MLAHLLIYLLSFLGIWLGSGLAVKSVAHLSKTLRISSFSASFIILGFFTSMSELSVGINSILDNDPEIYVGNLIGASIVLFILIIPLLAVAGHSIRITPEFRGSNLPASLVVVALPTLLILDGQVGLIDSALAIILFGLLLINMQTKKSWANKFVNFSPRSGTKITESLLKIFFGLAIVFTASRFVVEQTHYFSQLLKLAPFFISLILISLGTNIPELSLVLRAILMRNNQVAFGDLVGSAAFNTFLLGGLTFIYGKPVVLTNSYLISAFFLICGLIIFYYFSQTKNSISRLEGFALLGFYLAFIGVELALH